MKENLFHPTLEGTAYYGIDTRTLDSVEASVSSIVLISSIQVMAFFS